MARPVGRPRNMRTPEELLEIWDEYKSYIDTHLDKEQVVTVKGEIVEKKTKKPYLSSGFQSFVFRKYKISIKDYLSGKYDEFSDVVTCIRNEWEEDQVSGTITGKYKAPNLVARINGIVHKAESKIEHSGTINANFGNVVQSSSKSGQDSQGN
jgi:hypothetical protein